MAEKKKKITQPAFSAGQFRKAEEASMVPVKKETGGKTVVSTTYEGTGKNRVKVTKYSDNTESREAAPEAGDEKTITTVTYEGTGKDRVKVTKYSDGSETREAAPETGGNNIAKKLVSTYKDPATGDIVAVYDDETTAILVPGNLAGDRQRAGQSAFDLLKDQFNRFGLGALIDDVSKYIKDGLSADELLLRLRTESKAYKTRFGANDQRIAKGLRALSEAEYIQLEDQYQNIMRNYGLPESYYTRGDLGRQEGFEKFIAGDVSASELEDRIQTAQNRVLNANPEVATALRQFYPDITSGDILAYTLDPQKALTDIKRKVTAAEIGGAAMASGLATDVNRAEMLRQYGVTGQEAKQGYQAIAGVLPRATTLGDIYAKQGLGKYDQATAEAEVFGTPGSAEAAAKRKKLTELEQAQFSGSVGRAGSALSRERAGQF